MLRYDTSKLIPRFWPIFTDVQTLISLLNINQIRRFMDQNLWLAHCKLKTISVLDIKDLIFMLSSIKGDLQRENKLISYERAFKMLENDMYIARIGQAVLELLSFKVGSGNHQR